MEVFFGLHSKPKYDEVFFSSMALADNGFAYGASMVFNGIFRIDMKSGICRFMKFFPEEKIRAERLFYFCCHHEGKIYFSPEKAKNICVYDIAADDIQLIELPGQMLEGFNRSLKFCDIFSLGEFIYMMGASVPWMLRIHSKTLKITSHSLEVGNNFFFRKGIVVGERYYIASVTTNTFVEVNLTTMESRLHFLPAEQKGAWNLCYDGECLWFAPRYYGEYFIRYYPKTNKMDKIEMKPDELFPDRDSMYFHSFYRNGYVYAIPEQARSFVQLSVSALNFQEVEGFARLRKDEKLGVTLTDTDLIYVRKLPKRDSYYKQGNEEGFWYNKATGQKHCVRLSFKERIGAFWEGYQREIFDTPSKMLAENKGFTLNDMLWLSSMTQKMERIEHETYK